MSPTVAAPSTATAIHTSSKNVPVEFKHPLDPLTPDEIAAASLAIRHHVAAHADIKVIKFITLYLLPPPKKDVLAHLGIALSPGGQPETPKPIVRKAESDFLDILNGCAYNATLSLKDAKWSVDTLDKLSESEHPQISVEELLECEQVVKNDPGVQKLAKAVGVEPHEIFCDGWSIGFDERFPQHRRVQQALMFARFSEHENLYAHPLDFIAVVDAHAREVLHIDFPSHYKPGPNGPVPIVSSTTPPSLSEDPLAASGRGRIPPQRKAHDFLPDLIAETDKDFKLRTDIKPLHIVQPEGVSFKMNGNELEWQNWKMHISFTQREGIALSTITYNDHGEVRPLFYRLSLAEMVVPYGAPQHPHPRKFAFDSGEYGMGTMANELSLGCDCLGQIHYLPGSYVGHNGSAVVIKNVICIHEEDAGVLWKHTDYRPGGRAQTVRRRRLVVSMVCTLANYEYIWNYLFYQDGSIEFEIRLTGILQTYAANDGEPSQFATTVAPNISAQYHQHMFSVRVDPMIDGLNNSVVESDIIPLPDAPTGSTQNYAGNAFISQDTILKTESGRPYDYQKERRWKIVNPSRKHYSSGKAVGYLLGMKGGATPMVTRPDGWAARRAAFLTNTVWVCRDVEGGKGGRMWPAGKYVPQTREEPEDSIGKWVQGKGNVDNDDIVLFLTVGTTHIPRPEDWPVMPVEHLSLTFKPNSFFKVNPSMDVPGTSDLHSVPAFPNGSTVNNHNVGGHANGHTNGNTSNGACH
ncbi:copper amine oxidase [Collybia nuda]|uniref:Amine oxidase n=1 Tax=Collybia nuda TaxID=64659 RepID=A0A9P5YII1_9AGAR|nr:copper amine oxidase [Collybia nuda]